MSKQGKETPNNVHPFIGIGQIRKYDTTERFAFDFKTYEIFACDDETGSFQQASVGGPIQSLEEAEKLLMMIQEDMPQTKLFICELTRKAVMGNFSSRLIKRRQQMMDDEQ
jgi:hypothetical protein